MLLDTNAYSALANAVQSIVDVISGAAEIKIPLPVIAELRYGFLKGSQRQRNEQNLQKFLAQPQVSIVTPTLKTTEIYADLQLHCIKKGKVLSHNDLWIAASAKESNSTLVTFDKDFSALTDVFEDKLIILE